MNLSIENKIQKIFWSFSWIKNTFLGYFVVLDEYGVLLRGGFLVEYPLPGDFSNEAKIKNSYPLFLG